MREYSKVGPQFWTGPTGKQIRRHGMEAQLVAFYLLTSPHANMIGMYHLPVAYIAIDTGMPIEGASKGLQSLIEVGFCAYDADSEVVWVKEMAVYQAAESLAQNDKRCAGIQNQYDSIPDNAYLSDFFDKYSSAFHMKRRREGRPSASPFQAPSKPLASQEQEQEIFTNSDKPSLCPDLDLSSENKKPELRDQSERRDRGGKRGEGGTTAFQDACRVTWESYRDAYEQRYGPGTAPPRNAKVNAQVKTFVQHLGREEAPQIARWYVERCADRFAVVRRHELGLLVSQWQSMRTQWLTGQVATMTEATRAERTAANVSAYHGAVEILERQGFYSELEKES